MFSVNFSPKSVHLPIHVVRSCPNLSYLLLASMFVPNLPEKQRIQIQSLIYPLVNTPWAEELEPKNSAVLSGRGACELELGQKVEAD